MLQAIKWLISIHTNAMDKEYSFGDDSNEKGGVSKENEELF